MKHAGVSVIIFIFMSCSQAVSAANTCDFQPQWAVFEVNSDIDQVDLIPGDGICQFNQVGYCSLRAAVMEANALPGPNIIRMPAAFVARLTRAPVGADDDIAAVGDLDVTDDLVIVAVPGVDLPIVSISSSNNVRAFEVHKGAALCMERIIVRGSGTGIKEGGAIRVQEGKLIFHDGRFDLNTADHGGSVFVAAEGSAEINGTIFLRPSATQYGGAIFHAGDVLNINDSFFDRASAVNSGGAIFHQGKALNVSTSRFDKNHADQYGGAISAPAGSGRLSVSNNTQFYRNCAASGGAIASTGEVNIDGASFIDQAILFPCKVEYGGAIGHTGDGLVIKDSTFTGNRAEHGGGMLLIGGIAHVSDSLFDDNVAYSIGGALHLLDAGVELRGSTFTNNRVGVMGGALFSGTVYVSRHSAISDSEFTNNYAYITGGAIQSLDSTLFIKESSFLKNRVSNSGGAINSEYGALTLVDATLEENLAVFGGAIYARGSLLIEDTTLNNNRAALEGGAGYFEYVNARIKRSTVSNNFAGNPNYGGKSLGGGFLLKGARLVSINTTFSKNISRFGNGGAIASDGRSRVGLYSTTVYGNIARGRSGGGLYVSATPSLSMPPVNEAVFTLENTILAKNIAPLERNCYALPGPVAAFSSGHFNLIDDVAGCQIDGLVQLWDHWGDRRTGAVLPAKVHHLLKDNGGPTATHSLLDDSPAIDHGNYYGCKDDTRSLALDQRGYNRHSTTAYAPSAGSFCDIGAYERQRVRVIDIPGRLPDTSHPWIDDRE